MSLKRQHDMMAGFSMASMTDVVFLLLVFFMVTSTFVFPTALEIDLPQSRQQTPVKPATRVFIDSVGSYYVSRGDTAPAAVASDSLALVLGAIAEADTTGAAIAVHADVPYGKVVEVLNLGAENSIKMVLATRPSAPKASADSIR